MGTVGVERAGQRGSWILRPTSGAPAQATPMSGDAHAKQLVSLTEGH
jgi:hypothetical protein